jgi:hypothetical protein
VIAAVIDGQAVPLTDCCWIQRTPCGCVVSVVTAATKSRTLATAEQAHKELTPRKRDRDRDDGEGLTWELISTAHYREHIGAQWECPAHARPATE